MKKQRFESSVKEKDHQTGRSVSLIAVRLRAV